MLPPRGVCPLSRLSRLSRQHSDLGFYPWRAGTPPDPGCPGCPGLPLRDAHDLTADPPVPGAHPAVTPRKAEHPNPPMF
ncbi:hypothetical protein GCM10028799_11340 [Kribbella italica]